MLTDTFTEMEVDGKGEGKKNFLVKGSLEVSMVQTVYCLDCFKMC